MSEQKLSKRMRDALDKKLRFSPILGLGLAPQEATIFIQDVAQLESELADEKAARESAEFQAQREFEVRLEVEKERDRLEDEGKLMCEDMTILHKDLESAEKRIEALRVACKPFSGRLTDYIGIKDDYAMPGEYHTMGEYRMLDEALASDDDAAKEKEA